MDCSLSGSSVNKFSLGVEEGSSDEEELPKSGLLMALLGISFMNGNFTVSCGNFLLRCAGFSLVVA